MNVPLNKMCGKKNDESIQIQTLSVEETGNANERTLMDRKELVEYVT